MTLSGAVIASWNQSILRAHLLRMIVDGLIRMCVECGSETPMSDVEIISESPKRDGEVKPDVPARVISSVMGLMGFFTALLVGLVAGNPGVTIVLRALLAMAICAVVGRILGTVGEICVREFLNKYKTDRPMPVLPEQLQRLYEERAQDEALRASMKKAA